MRRVVRLAHLAPLRIAAIAAVAGCVSLVASAASADESVVRPGDRGIPAMSPDHAGRIREEIHLHEARAHELDPMIQRDRQARHDVEGDWVVLERHAREMHARAAEFRQYASEVAGRAQGDLNQFASELDTSAQHDEENAHFQHEIGERLDRAIASESATRDWHLKLVQRLRDWLAANGF